MPSIEQVKEETCGVEAFKVIVRFFEAWNSRHDGELFVILVERHDNLTEFRKQIEKAIDQDWRNIGRNLAERDLGIDVRMLRGIYFVSAVDGKTIKLMSRRTRLSGCPQHGSTRIIRICKTE